MNIKAFDIQAKINEKEFYPDNYIIDNELDKDIIDFFNNQKNDEHFLPKKQLIKDTNVNKNFEKNNFEDYNEEEEEESSESSELIYSSFPDNIIQAKNKIYDNIHINKDIIKMVIDEYNKVKNKFLNEFKNRNENSLEKDKFIFNSKEFDKYDNTPSDLFIMKNILPFKSNGYLMKNINKSFKVLKRFNKGNKKEINKLSQWIYTFLLFLEIPLSPEYCSDLYSINKYIYNNFTKVSELKIIFVIICEIFKQILVL